MNEGTAKEDQPPTGHDGELFKLRVNTALCESDEMRRAARGERLIWLAPHIPEFGMLSGPVDTLALIEEARVSFIDGHFIAALLISLASIERSIFGVLADRGIATANLGLKAAFVLVRAKATLPGELLDRADELRAKRNALTHPRAGSDPDGLGHRFQTTGRHPEAILEEDAKEALAVMYELLRLTVRAGTLP